MACIYIASEKKISLDCINQKWVQCDISGGVAMARSTFNRHKRAIEDIFDIIIECDKKDGYEYYIENEEILGKDSIQNWMLSFFSIGRILNENKRISDRILTEAIPEISWTKGSAGTLIDEKIAQRIDALWKSHIESLK